jgi:hypothetical protein
MKKVNVPFWVGMGEQKNKLTKVKNECISIKIIQNSKKIPRNLFKQIIPIFRVCIIVFFQIAE